MASTHDRASSPVTSALPSPGAATSRLHFSLLTQTEKASFEAGLHTRLWSRVFEAVKSPTAGEYARARGQNILPYHHLSEILRLETGHMAEPITDDQVMHALAQVERDLGESWRHKLEHAINTSQAAQKIMARVNERRDGKEVGESQIIVATRWVGGWILLNWAIDCVFAATSGRVVAQPEVIEAMFNDLREAADSVYIAACEAHDARFGDPDDQDDE